MTAVVAGFLSMRAVDLRILLPAIAGRSFGSRQVPEAEHKGKHSEPISKHRRLAAMQLPTLPYCQGCGQQHHDASNPIHGLSFLRVPVQRGWLHSS